jgi:hypothetical protein
MLPFRVIQLEQYRTLQQNPANPSLEGSSPLPELSSKRNFATRSRRLSGPFSPGDSAAQHARNMVRPIQENEAFLAKWAPTSNRFWVKNRCCTKQKTKPRLTGARTAFREFQKSLKMDPNFGLFFAPISGAKSGGIA